MARPVRGSIATCISAPLPLPISERGAMARAAKLRWNAMLRVPFREGKGEGLVVCTGGGQLREDADVAEGIPRRRHVVGDDVALRVAGEDERVARLHVAGDGDGVE